MNKIIIIFVTLIFNFQLSTFNCLAQPNAGFENWIAEYNYESPDQWQTINFLTLTNPPNPLSAFKTVGLDVHSGSYALKLKTVYLNNNPWPHSIADTTAAIFTGKITASPFSYHYGFPYSARPEKLEFWSKYSPVGIDTAAALVFLLKWNGFTHDTIASGQINIPFTQAYNLFQMSITYHLNTFPDSATIIFSSSKNLHGAKVGSELFIDDVALTGWVGIDESKIYQEDKIKVFPNPAKDNITIAVEIQEADNIKVIDVSGRLSGIYKIQNYKTNINTSAFAEGVYLCEIRDNKNHILTQSKFNVLR